MPLPENKTAMDELNLLSKNQETLGQEMLKLLTNLKKDGRSRKTADYLDQKTRTLDAFWDEAQTTHTKMVSLDNSSNHKYFAEQYFQQMEKLQKSTKEYIKDCQKNLADELGRKNGESEIENNDFRIQIKELKRVIDQINHDLQQQVSKMRYKILLNKLNSQWEGLQKVKKNDPTDVQWFYEAEQDYESTLEKVMIKIDEMSSRDQTHELVLPQIKLPIFNGGYEEWSTFYDLFQKVIDRNGKISNAEKMHYLKAYLRGEPSKLIQHLQTTESNYKTALTLLTSRYQNERLLTFNLVDKILDLPQCEKGSINNLKTLHDTIVECLQGIQNLGVDTKTWGPIISRIVSRKWDSETNTIYEQSLGDSHKLEELSIQLEFLQKRFQSLEIIGEQKLLGLKTKIQREKPKMYCNYCEEQHWITQCQKFKKLEVPQRIQAIEKKKLCKNCFKHDTLTNCYSTSRCSICSGFHNSLLHREKKSVSNENTKSKKNETKQLVSNIAYQEKNVLLATALVKAKSAAGIWESLRVLIDPGSQASFITEEAAQLLSIPKLKIRAEVSGLGQQTPQISTSKVEVLLNPHFRSSFSTNVELLVLRKLTQRLPQKEVRNDLTKWQNYILADPTYFKPGPIDVILGASDYSKIITNGLVKDENGLMAQSSELGWLISGVSELTSSKEIKVISMITRCAEDNQLTKFWELEDISDERESTAEEKACENQYQQTTNRNLDGTYTVKIPFKNAPSELGESKARAAARLFQLEKKFVKDHELSNEYKQFMQEYLDLGHMQIVPKFENNQGRYYIPHQAVIKMDSTTTKLRVVFDASSKTTTGISLNEISHTGPRLQQELSDILLRWRLHKIVFSADIEKMYRQIRIHKDHQKYQRILWRFDPSDPIQEYDLTTVTYGTTSAPYLAVRTLQQLADDEASNFPKGSVICKRDFYVDDVLSGANSQEEAREIQSELISMLRKGGFGLRKWSSNDIKLVESLPEKLQDQTTLKTFEDGTKKSLGLHWAPKDDVFRFQPHKIDCSVTSKRQILSEISKIFDPLGWMAPVIIRVKLLIQELWVEDLGWDQNVPTHLADKWLKFESQLRAGSVIELPRWVNFETGSTLELHGFCDASEKAYGAAIYSKTTTENKNTHVHLLVAKSKVAPLKTKTTLPRLELCASELLAKLMKKTVLALGKEHLEVHAWTDSMITLGWIKGEPQRWKTFVANRVSRIQNIIDSKQWHHVKTEENPADLITRGIEPSKLINNTLWWHGPTWLQEDKKWSENKEEFMTTEEIKISCNSTTIVKDENEIIQRFSKLHKLIRVFSYCRRFINNCRKQEKINGEYLTVPEINATMAEIIKTVQAEKFANEIGTLKKNKCLEKTNKLLSLNPFIDNQGLLRVGGRLQHSSMLYDEKHPIILPHSHHITNLIIDEAHHMTLHGGTQTTLAYTRRKYWIINGKKMIGLWINKCSKCIRYKSQASQQLMGNLPAPRVTPSSPFTHTGVDYAGPIQIRTTKGRGYKSYKGYIAVFVCLATKAFHLEVVSDLTTEAFLAAYRRFIARRGICLHMYSDNGTTFIGASKTLASIPESLTSQGTEWHFIPPSAPHFGGLWEAGVKSMKHHLKRVIGDSKLTFEEMSTLIYQIEACLNSRPLCPLSNNPDELAVLTPGHFLTGKSILSPSDIINAEENVTPLSRWRMLQKLKNDFWKSWSSEYLGRLQQRYKWKTPTKNIEIGQVVIIKEDNINPSKWPLAKVKTTHAGKDGKIRVVTLKQATGQDIKRPIHKLIPLPKGTEEPDNEAIKVSVNTVSVALTEKDSQTPKKTKSQRKFWLIAMFLMLVGNMVSNVNANYYTIKNPKPGLYIEHIGQSKVKRGLFKIELRYPKEKLHEDVKTVAKITQQMTELCENVKTLSDNTPCNQLVHHLNELQEKTEWIEVSLMSQRTRRGLMGDFLTSVFGVNDEVYKDIEQLDKNQHDLIRATNHQTKFMLSTLTHVNETELRTQQKLEHFQAKLNEGIKAINEMTRWYKTIDENKLSIHVLVTYQIAANFINEIITCYSNILNVQFNKGQFYKLISPKHVNEVINNASSKLPSNIQILPLPLLSTKIQSNIDCIQVYGIFPITEFTKFELIKTTPIPFEIKNNSYWVLKVSRDIIAMDYNSQEYFQLSDEELRQCTAMNQNSYLRAPTMVKNIENNPNYVIDEIYNRTDQTNCKVEKIGISSLIWIQLYMTNTWMFITNKPTKVIIICNGEREDVRLNNSGLIQISQECVIKTKRTTLSAERTNDVRVISGFNKHVPIHINTSIDQTNYHKINPEVEPVVKLSDELADINNEERNLQNELDETTWKQIKHHSTLSNMVSISIILGFGVIGFLIKSIWKKWKRRPSVAENPPPNEEIELRPIFPHQYAEPSSS